MYILVKNPEDGKHYKILISDEEKIKVGDKIPYYENHKTDLKFNLNGRMRTAIGATLKGNKNCRKWENLVGYSVDKLMEHLKKTMPKGYSWGDYLKGKLHIDHIIPISAHNFTKTEHTDFKRCWALKNLRLLPAKENRIKFNHLGRPFQPALLLNR